tara:strand:+ start:6764 stop:8356 length:1593 start_codon:yes stop_codon:yes gene_type:complete
MIERKVNRTSSITRRASVFLTNELRDSNRIESRLIVRSLRIKKKIVADRNRTLIALYKSSIEEKRDRKGVGTLGLLGTGLLGRRLLRGKVPKIPKVARTSTTVSRVGKLGRLGKVGPLAILGTGLDFVGRKAEGQTNLQAGLGAGGGLAGALAGAKYGAILGTAIGGPIGTAIGGIGGGIIGGLAGGKIADLFTGADRRRKFEIQRSLLATQKTVFSDALDDLDRVLDKLDIKSSAFEDAVLGGRDDEPPIQVLPPSPLPRPNVLGQELAKWLAIAGLTFVLIPTDFSDLATTAPVSVKLLKLIKSTRLFRLLKTTPAVKKPPKVDLKKIEKIDDFEELIPGIDIPAISAKGLRIRAQALMKKVNPNIKFDNVPKRQPSLKELLKKERILQDKLYEIIKNAPPEKFREIMNKYIKKGELRVPKSIQKKGNVKINVDKSNSFPSGSPDMTGTNSNPLGGFNKLSDASLEPSDNNNIALAPTNNIFLINQQNNNNNNQPVVFNPEIKISGSRSVDPYLAMAEYGKTTALMTT